MIGIGRTAIVLTLLLTGSAFAQQQPTAPPAAAPPPVDFSKVEIKTTDLGDNVYMLEGQGGNITVAVGKAGIIMVDGQFAPLHDKIKAAISTISNLPIKYLINTHYHGDHTGGNEGFAKDGAIVVADINVKIRLSDGTTNGLTGVKTPPATGTTLPPDISESAPKKVGRSFRRSLSARLDSPIPTAPQALPTAIFGRKMLAPSSRLRALRQPPSSSTATHMGRYFASRALASALSTMTEAFSSDNFIGSP